MVALVVAGVLVGLAVVLVLPLVSQLRQLGDEAARLRREVAGLKEAGAELAEVSHRAARLRDAPETKRVRSQAP